ncbi:fatty acid desaturase [Streptomyces sp. ISL-66]|uniref:fatty acid desaturase family protein n=1 Tax=Streptomyces sp. ISL-66 TaxID=2819186 RepID=UPI001BE60931|nr:fatty acid desaturase [Streptomyces sp. ISL-66]MBT2472444.1 fatty acid desaturase [Streptomyces sp. ISL-66]
MGQPQIEENGRQEISPRETMRGLPKIVQPYLTWITGVPLQGGKQLIPWSPAKAGLLGLGQMAAGISVGAWALHPFTAWSVPVLILCWLVTSGGMRRLDVVVIHQTLHRMFTKSVRGNRIVGELISTFFWRSPYDDNRKEHLAHHAFPCSLKDGDTHYLLSTGMRPGMTRSEFRKYIWGALFSPSHHSRFFFGRLKSNFIGVQPRYRLVMSVVYLAAVATFIALTGWWMEWLVLWLVPVSVFFQSCTYLYTMTEHRWWLFGNHERLPRDQRDLLTFGRFCGEAVPDDSVTGLRKAAAWTRWTFRMLVVHSSYRMFVLVGDTVQHDLHHVMPACDWANSPWIRADDVGNRPERYTEVWGSLADHLRAAGQVDNVMTGLPEGVVPTEWSESATQLASASASSAPSGAESPGQ